MAAGNSLTIRSTGQDAVIRLLQAWADSQVAGNLRIRSPRMHDNVQGLRLRHVASEVQPLLPAAFKEQLFPQDDLVAEMTGSATASDIETACLLIYYSDIPGIAARFITPEELAARGRHVLTVENSIATGTAGGYSGEEALNAEFDLLKANTDYALPGYLVSAECAAVRWRGVDLGNLGVGGPGNETRPDLTHNWFERLSIEAGVPLIPVINATNVAGILVDAAQDENGTDVILTTILVELERG